MSLKWKMINAKTFTANVGEYNVEIKVGSVLKRPYWEITKGDLVLDNCFMHNPTMDELNAKVQAERSLNKIMSMKTIKKVEITPVFVETIPTDLENNKIYISETYDTSSHNCLCGCGRLTVLPLSKGFWELTKHTDGKVSFSPSICNFQYPCKSHYIITKNVANFV